MTQQIGRNYDRIKADAQAIINMEMERIKNDPELCCVMMSFPSLSLNSLMTGIFL